MDSENKDMFAAPTDAEYWTKEDLSRLLLWAIEHKVSDITIIPDTEIRMRMQGVWKRVTAHPVTHHNAVDPILTFLSSDMANTWTRIMSMEYLDFAYSIRNPLNKWQRFNFRVNATGCKYKDGSSAALVLRTIPSEVPTIDMLKLEVDLVRKMLPKNGLVLITGVMGSGKSTSLAAITRYLMETESRHIVTFEAPIEFDLMQLNEQSTTGGVIVQTEVGKHIKTFGDAPVNTTRRAPDVAIYGEIREPETIAGAIEQAEIGTLVFATVHTSSVASTPNRVVNVFSAEERHAKTAAFLSSISFIMHQRLIPTIAGGRFAAREWLQFTEDFKEKLLKTDQKEWTGVIEEEVGRRGLLLMDSVQKAYDDGLISKLELDYVIREKSRSL